MTATAVDISTPYKVDTECAIPWYASSTYYAGSFVCVGADGYLRDGADTAGFIFAGLSREGKTATSTSGAGTVRVLTDGIVKALGSGFSQASVGDVVYLSDNQTVTTTVTTNKIIVGTIVAYEDSTHVWVRLRGLNQMAAYGLSGAVKTVYGYASFSTAGVSKAVTITPITSVLAATVSWTSTVTPLAADGPLYVAKTAGTSSGTYQLKVYRAVGTADAPEFSYVIIGT